MDLRQLQGRSWRLGCNRHSCSVRESTITFELNGDDQHDKSTETVLLFPGQRLLNMVSGCRNVETTQSRYRRGVVPWTLVVDGKSPEPETAGERAVNTAKSGVLRPFVSYRAPERPSVRIVSGPKKYGCNSTSRSAPTASADKSCKPLRWLKVAEIVF
jgi:hypothetical protein